jgi:hypothetical protein
VKEKDKPEAVADVPPAAVEAPSGTITMVGEKNNGAASAKVGAAPEGEVADTAQPPPGNLDKKRQRYQQLELELGRLRTQKGELERRAHSSVNLDEARGLRNQAANLETRIQRILAEQKTLLVEGNTATVNTGDDQGTRQRIRFLDAAISKLRQEKAQLEQQAHSSVSLDDAKVLRDKADGLFTRIQSLEAERERLAARLSQQQP